MPVLDTIATQDRFFTQQKFTPLVNKYRVSTLAADGKSEGEPLVFVQQKRMKIREQIEFFSDEGRNDKVFEIKRRNILEFRGRSDVKLVDGTVIGQLQKVFGKSLLRSTWLILDAEGNQVAEAQESSMPIAILRRAWDFIPILSSIPCIVPFHFDISIDGNKVGEHRRMISLSDRYVLDLSGDSERRIDRRVAVAFTVALDALQDR